MPSFEPASLIYRLRDIENGFPRLRTIRKYDPALVEELIEVQLRAREYAEQHIRPVALKLDQRIAGDHSYFAWDLVEKALPFGFLGFIVPRSYGGRGKTVTHMAVLMEELCAYCPGIANIFGAHALGISPLLLAPDLRHYERYLRVVAEKERAGEPVLFALAITEPDAGSDVEDADFLQTARLSTRARKVTGGYRLSGRKVFISNGSVARYIWVGSYLDPEQPVETAVCFVVPNDAPGFSVGRVEHKLGQRACPASELIFDDVFIPEEDRVGEEGEAERLTAVVLGASRGPVAAIATGTARGAFERLIEYLQQKKVNGRYLFEEQRVQMALVDMMAKIQLARQIYLDSVMAYDLMGMTKLIRHPLMKMMDRIPTALHALPPYRQFLHSKSIYQIGRWLAEREVTEQDIAYTAGLSSLAKYLASDLAMEVCSQALEIMGPDGPIPEFGVEKAFRDVKLTQIYEGTNQINRIYAFKQLLLK